MKRTQNKEEPASGRFPGIRLALGPARPSLPPALLLVPFFLLPFCSPILHISFILLIASTFAWDLLLYKFDLHGPSQIPWLLSASISFSIICWLSFLRASKQDKESWLWIMFFKCWISISGINQHCSISTLLFCSNRYYYNVFYWLFQPSSSSKSQLVFHTIQIFSRCHHDKIIWLF